MERVKLKEPTKFFDEILNERSLRSFSKEIGINYSTLKKWRRGVYLIPKKQFNNLLKFIKNKEYWLNNITFNKENWGRSKGGKITISKLSKKELNRKLEKVRSKIKKRRCNKTKLLITKNLCEFYGILIGDGCLSKFKRKDGGTRRIILISGHKHLDKDYHENYIRNLIKKEFNLNTYTYCNKKHNSRSFIINNRSFFEALVNLGFPIGKKGQKVKIPKKLLKLPWDIKKYILRGIFDTDGCISARKDENYKYIHIIISTQSKPLLKQIYKLLKEQGYPAWINKSRPEVRIKGIKNTNKWMNDIGSSNWKHLVKYKYWLRNNKLPSNINWALSSPVDL